MIVDDCELEPTSNIDNHAYIITTFYSKIITFSKFGIDVLLDIFFLNGHPFIVEFEEQFCVGVSKHGRFKGKQL